jgi:molecular chaperone DnaJ
MKDYYKILGVEKGASADDIKKAYRKLAHQHHPDKSGGDEAKFKEINEAYQVLSDQSKRSNYDRFGTADGAQGGFGGFGQGGGGFGGGFGQGFEGFQNGGGFPGGVQWEGDMGDLGDMFENIFEGLGVRPRRPTYHRGSDIEVTETVTLEDALEGVKKELKFKTLLACTTCKGEGGDPSAGSKECTTCNGRGEIREERQTFFGPMAQVRACTTCKGRGKIPNKVCATCKGEGRVKGERNVGVEILAGIQDNQIIKIQGAGEAGEKGTSAGDLYIHVRVKPHAVFAREGDDLVIKKELRIFDLLLGRTLSVTTLAGKVSDVEIPAQFNLKDRLRVKGEGMPHLGSHGRGDLLIDFIIKAPKKVSGKEAKVLEDIERGV